MRKLNELSDEELAVDYINGNNHAFDLLLSRNQSKIFSYILFVVRDRDVADDVFQETFVKVITKLQQGKYTVTGKFCAWVMRIAHNIIMDMYREQKSEKIVEATEDNDLSNFGSKELLDENIESKFVNEQILCDVKRMMNLLPTAQREVVYMRFYQQLSFKEIADTTNVSINTALGRMRYAIINLRKMAQEHQMELRMM